MNPNLMKLSLLLLFFPSFASASDGLNGANTAWILTATALVLLMTLPGLSLFYGGLVRVKNILSVLMQCFAITCVASLIWLVAGYSLAFTEGNAFIGGFSNVLLGAVGEERTCQGISQNLYL
jgi:Amt family ammonium transporter